MRESEAELFFHLTLLQQAKASELARAAGCRRPDVYALLDQLTDKGLVQRSAGRPTLFIPVGIATAVTRLVDRERARTERMEAQARELESLWPRGRSDVAAPDDRIALHQGVDQILSILKERATGARHHIMCILSPGLLSRLKGLFGAIHDKNPTCPVHIVTMLDNEEDGHELQEIAATCNVRHEALPSHLELILVDDREAFLFLSAGRADSTHATEETALWLRSTDIVLAFQAVFDQWWGDAIDMPDRMREIREGKPIGRIETMCGRWVRCTRVRDAILRAEKEIQCYADGVEVADWEEVRIAPALRRRLDEGLRIETHVHGGEIDRIPSTTLARPPAATTFIIDRREAVCAFRPEGGASTPSRERSIWTTHPDLVQLVMDARPTDHTVAMQTRH